MVTRALQSPIGRGLLLVALIGRGGDLRGADQPPATPPNAEKQPAGAQERDAANAPFAHVEPDADRFELLWRDWERRGGLFGGVANISPDRAASALAVVSQSLSSSLLQELMNTDVQIELEISAAQWTALEVLCADAVQAQREINNNFRTDVRIPDPFAPVEPDERILAATRELRAAAEDELQKLLTADQFQRLQQLAWQTVGAPMLHDGQFTADLKLTRAQQTRLGALQKELSEPLTNLLLPPYPEAAPPTLASLLGSDVCDERLLAVLTDEQRGLYERQLGPPRESSDIQQLAQHAFALLDVNSDEQLDDAERHSEDARRILPTISRGGMPATPLSREEFVRMFVAARQMSIGSVRPGGV